MVLVPSFQKDRAYVDRCFFRLRLDGVVSLALCQQVYSALCLTHVYINAKNEQKHVLKRKPQAPQHFRFSQTQTT